VISIVGSESEEIFPASRLVADGLGNREIADRMNLSEQTVKNCLFHIFDKLGISNRVELVLYAMSNPSGDKASSSRKEPAVEGSTRTG
jgi:Bacterial regulatory proteins, luxR family